MYRAVIVSAALLTYGCAARRPAEVYRLARQSGGIVLIPPGVRSADIAQRTFKPGILPGTGSCDSSGGIAVQHRGRGIRITVRREALEKQPPAWLSRWASEAEARGCVAPGSAAELADRIIEAVPLDPAVAWRLLNDNDVRAGYVDLGPGNRLQVDGPIFRDGTPPDALTIDSIITGGTGGSINVDVKASSALVGFERAWYAVVPRKAQPGYTIEPLSAERHINGQTEARPAPATDHFRFDREAAWYRLLYRADRTIMVVGAPNHSELERLSKEIETAPSTCEALAGRYCALIPKNVGVNPDVMVRVRGEERALPVGATVGNAIRAAGDRPEDTLSRLSVMRRYAGRLVTVEFDRTASDVLALRLSGGEALEW
jgi:hypothetical protein